MQGAVIGGKGGVGVGFELRSRARVLGGFGKTEGVLMAERRSWCGGSVRRSLGLGVEMVRLTAVESVFRPRRKVGIVRAEASGLLFFFITL